MKTQRPRVIPEEEGSPDLFLIFYEFKGGVLLDIGLKFRVCKIKSVLSVGLLLVCFTCFHLVIPEIIKKLFDNSCYENSF
jgi:hypothetical protein